MDAGVVDFKTDRIESGDDVSLAARTEHYRSQIGPYCEVVRARCGMAKGEVVGRLLFLGAGVAR